MQTEERCRLQSTLLMVVCFSLLYQLNSKHVYSDESAWLFS